MLLAIDVGNTNIVLGVFAGERLVQSWRLTTLRERTADELGLLVNGLFDVSHVDRGKIRHVIMASVVPPLTSPARAMVERYLGLKVMVVEPGLPDLAVGQIDEPTVQSAGPSLGPWRSVTNILGCRTMSSTIVSPSS